MDSYYTQKASKSLPESCLKLSRASKRSLESFMGSLLVTLNELMDKRLVRTLYLLTELLASLSKSRHSLQLTTLGGRLLGEFQSTAGMKRIHRLLESPKWSCRLLHEHIKKNCIEYLDSLPAGEMRLLLWDDSELEKHESSKAEGLCPVRSSKFKRLIRIRPGFYNPPTKKPGFVAGFHWIGLVGCGLHAMPQLFEFRFWTSRGPDADGWLSQHLKLLFKVHERLADSVIHVFDRGFCSQNWLRALTGLGARFLIRWNGKYKLENAKGELKNTYKHSLGKKAASTRKVWDMKRNCYRKAGVLFMPVVHPKVPDALLYLVICRPGKKGQKPWYLITSERVESAKQAWKIVFAYSRRWLVETAFRYNKAELGIESIRLKAWEKRMKLISIIMLVYAFLLSTLNYAGGILLKMMLKIASDRKRKRYRDASIPLYRIREILDFLWNQVPLGKFG